MSEDLNAFAMLILSKDYEWLDPKYEYYSETPDEKRVNAAIKDTQEIKKSLYANYMRYGSSGHDLATGFYYYVKLGKNSITPIKTKALIPEDEIIRGNIYGPFMNESVMNHYVSLLNER